jgi:hypothetical protein
LGEPRTSTAERAGADESFWIQKKDLTQIIADIVHLL